VLVDRGVPFRQAHGVVARVAAEARKRHLGLKQMAALSDWSPPPPLVSADLLAVDVLAAVQRRNATAGTGRDAVLEQIRQAHERVQGF
jgi:argininosuccinate lyase